MGRKTKKVRVLKPEYLLRRLGTVLDSSIYRKSMEELEAAFWAYKIMSGLAAQGLESVKAFQPAWKALTKMGGMQKLVHERLMSNVQTESESDRKKDMYLVDEEVESDDDDEIYLDCDDIVYDEDEEDDEPGANTIERVLRSDLFNIAKKVVLSLNAHEEFVELRGQLWNTIAYLSEQGHFRKRNLRCASNRAEQVAEIALDVRNEIKKLHNNGFLTFVEQVKLYRDVDTDGWYGSYDQAEALIEINRLLRDNDFYP